MNINATLFGQMISFAIFLLIAMKWIWPLFKKTLDERAKKIADGLAAAAQGHHALEKARVEGEAMIQEAKGKAHHMLEETSRRTQVMIETAKSEAQSEAARIIAQAHSEIDSAEKMAREKLRQETAALAISIAQKILEREVNSKDVEQLLAKVR